MDWDVTGNKGPEPQVQGGLLVVNRTLKFEYENRGTLGCLVTREVRLDTPTTGSSSDLLLDPTSERGVNVGLRQVFSTPSSRDQYGPFGGRSGRGIPVANPLHHFPSVLSTRRIEPSWEVEPRTRFCNA